MLEGRKIMVGGKSTNPLDDPTDNKTYIGGATTPEELAKKITDSFKNAIIKSKKIKENLKQILETVVPIKSENGGGLIIFQPPEGESIPQITKFIHISKNQYKETKVSNTLITTSVNDDSKMIEYDSKVLSSELSNTLNYTHIE
jgi:hypothetical protein